MRPPIMAPAFRQPVPVSRRCGSKAAWSGGMRSYQYYQLKFSDVPKIQFLSILEHMTCQKDRQPEVDGNSTFSRKENHLKIEMLKNLSSALTYFTPFLPPMRKHDQHI